MLDFFLPVHTAQSTDWSTELRVLHQRKINESLSPGEEKDLDGIQIKTINLTFLINVSF